MNTQKKLQDIANGEDGNTLKKYIAEYWLNQIDGYNGEAEGWYKDLMQGGCKSGMVGGLIYYKDTHEFYNEYADEIDEILDEIAEETGEEVKPEHDRRNFYAWLGFEEMARKIAIEIGIEE